MALIIFDLDGTLVDSHDGLAYSMNLVLDELGLGQHPHEAYMGFVGNGIKMLVQRALPEGSKDLLEKAFQRMNVYYELHYDRQLSVYDGIYEVLDTLVGKGYKIALVTNKNQHMADVIMSKFFKDYPFIEVAGVSDTNPAKPDPTTILRIMERAGADAVECTMVGDTEVDLKVARNAGINEIFVTWGFRKLDDVQSLSPKQVVDLPLDLLNVYR